MRLGPREHLVDGERLLERLLGDPALLVDALALDHRDLRRRPAPGEGAELEEADEHPGGESCPQRNRASSPTRVGAAEGDRPHVEIGELIEQLPGAVEAAERGDEVPRNQAGHEVQWNVPPRSPFGAQTPHAPVWAERPDDVRHRWPRLEDVVGE